MMLNTGENNPELAETIQRLLDKLSEVQAIQAQLREQPSAFYVEQSLQLALSDMATSRHPYQDEAATAGLRQILQYIS
jgi:hypothetical protein